MCYIIFCYYQNISPISFSYYIERQNSFIHTFTYLSIHQTLSYVLRATDIKVNRTKQETNMRTSNYHNVVCDEVEVGTLCDEVEVGIFH